MTHDQTFSLIETRYYRTPYSFTLHSLDHSLPARRQDRLHVLWPLIDRLVPGETGLLAE